MEDGILYATGSWSVVYAIDAKTGELRWTYDPKVSRERAFFICCDVVNRGVALYRGKVYLGTLEGSHKLLENQFHRQLYLTRATEVSGGRTRSSRDHARGC